MDLIWKLNHKPKYNIAVRLDYTQIDKFYFKVER